MMLVFVGKSEYSWCSDMLVVEWSLFIFMVV